MGVSVDYKAVVTFESDRGEPLCIRTTIVESEPDDAARKAVFRALPEATRLRWESIVIVLEKITVQPAAEVR